jgi:hypothetical protein
MFWIDQPIQSFFKPILTRNRDLKTGNYTGSFYVGVGDEFDDDRRIVRETVSTPCRAAHLTIPRSACPLAMNANTGTMSARRQMLGKFTHERRQDHGVVLFSAKISER